MGLNFSFTKMFQKNCTQVPRMEKRVNTVAKLGYKKCIVPKSAEKALRGLAVGDMVVFGCWNLKEVINTVFSG